MLTQLSRLPGVHCTTMNSVLNLCVLNAEPVPKFLERNYGIRMRKGFECKLTVTHHVVCLPACIDLNNLVFVCCPVADVAGGYSASILDALRRALDSSKILTIQDPGHETLTFEEAFRIATLGGSQGKTHSCRSDLSLYRG